MAHVQKNNKSATGHLLDHYGRNAIDEQYKHLYRENDSIDPQRTQFNYNLATREGSQKEILDKRLSEIKVLNRKDVNVMCSWVVTLPKKIRIEQEKEFFQQTYKFLEKRYGEKNVISAYVHKDEITPHMHFAFVPAVKDKKKNIEKLSAKECVTRFDLETFHKDLSKHMEYYFGRDVGILNEATKEGNKSIDELKRGTAKEELENIARTYENTLETLEKVNSSIESLQEQKDSLERQINDFEILRGSVVPVKEKKALFSNKVKEVTMSKDVYDACVSAQMRDQYVEMKLKHSEEEIKTLKSSSSFKEVKRLSEKIDILESKNKHLKDVVNKQEKSINRVNNVFEKNADVKESFFNAEKKDKALQKAMKSKTRGWDMER